MAKKHQRIAGISFGDRHGGLKNGLIMPGTKLTYGVGEEAEEREVILSDWSEWLWREVWSPAVVAAIEWAGDDPLIACDSGDAVHGSRFVENLYSPHVNHQIQISQWSLAPLREAPTLAGYLLAFGTGSHDYGSNSAAILLGEKLANWGWACKADEHLRIMLHADFMFDLAHHGPNVSQRPHLRENGARSYARDILQTAVEYGVGYPQLIQRGHVHMHTDTPVKLRIGPREHRSHVMITPPLCGPNGFARKAGRSPQFIDCGVYLWELIDGRLGDVRSFIVSRDARNVYSMPAEGLTFFKYQGTPRKKKRKKKVKA